MLSKFLFILPSRKFSHICHIVLLFIIIFLLYVITSLYSVNNDKLPFSQEMLNETVFTETAFMVNTETPNEDASKHTSPVYTRPVLVNETVSTLHMIHIGEIVPNCGLPTACSSGTFAVHIYTGKDHRDEPRLCVDGKYILSKDINNGGRGVNAVVIDNMTRTVIRVNHFDTYEKESTPLETMLLTLRPGDIVILLTFDEPSRRMSRIARLLLHDLGSALIQNLSYRGSWYLITQKGLSGFSPFEDLHLVENSGWPKHHDVRFCVPFEIKGTVIHPDPLPSNNPARVEFCEKHDNFPIFCDADVVDDPLAPSPVWKQPSAINKIYNVPIIVMSGDNIQFLPLTLETLVRQPGIKPSLVIVYHLSKNMMVQNLSDLFGYIAEELSPNSYCERVAEAFEITNLLFPEASEVIFIGENAVLAPDFLFYMGQLLSILHMDQTILSVSALNENGFKSMSGDPSLSYRAETFSSLAVLVRKNFFQRSWCKKQYLIDPLYISSKIVGDSLIPDVSRVALAAPMESKHSNQDASHVFMSYDRTITYEQNILLKNPERLFLEDYDHDLEILLASSVPLEFDAFILDQCMKRKEHFHEKRIEDLPHFFSNTSNLSNKVLAVFFHQASADDVSTIQNICQCFGLFYHPLYPMRGFYKGVLRFMLKENQALLVSSRSPFFHFRPKQAPILRIEQHLGNFITTIL